MHYVLCKGERTSRVKSKVEIKAGEESSTIPTMTTSAHFKTRTSDSPGCAGDMETFGELDASQPGCC